MTEREQLVERVARALLQEDMNPAGNWHDYVPLANTSIAEYEKDRTVLGNYHPLTLLEKMAILEAQCAAMRDLLNNLSMVLVAYNRSPRMDSQQIDTLYFVDKIKFALSPDAGEKVLEVVRAAEETVNFCDDPHGSENPETLAMGLARILPKMRRALSALGWKS